MKDVRVPEQLIQATSQKIFFLQPPLSSLFTFLLIFDVPFGGLTNQTGYGCGGAG